MRHFLFALALLASAGFACAAPTPAELYAAVYWRIEGAPGKITWIEIHEHPDVAVGADAVVHVSVLARKQGAPVWEIEHVCPHLAITTEALARSVQHPYKTRAAYPEAYFAGYEAWKADEKNGKAAICTTSIREFFLAH